MNTKLLEKYMSTPTKIEITITDEEMFRRTAILSEKGNYNLSDRYEGAPITVSIDDEDLPDDVDSAEQLELRIKELVYTDIFVN